MSRFYVAIQSGHRQYLIEEEVSYLILHLNAGYLKGFRNGVGLWMLIGYIFHHHSTRIGQRLGVARAAVDNWRVSRSKVLCISPRTNRMLERNNLRFNIQCSRLGDAEYNLTGKIQQWRIQFRARLLECSAKGHGNPQAEVQFSRDAA